VSEHAGIKPDAAAKVAVAESGVALRARRFARVIDEYQGSLLRYVGRMIGYRDGQSEDIVQECFLRLHRVWGDAAKPAIVNVRSWLFRVAHNLTMDVIRKRKRHRTMQENITGHTPMTNEISVLGRITQCEAAAAALSAVDLLPDEQKQVLLMKVIEGMTFRQIARMTGLSLGSVNNRLNQALVALSSRLKHLGHM